MGVAVQVGDGVSEGKLATPAAPPGSSGAAVGIKVGALLPWQATASSKRNSRTQKQRILMAGLCHRHRRRQAGPANDQPTLERPLYWNDRPSFVPKPSNPGIMTGVAERMKGTILVSGLINIETTLQVEAFPIPYSPVRYPFFGIGSSVSGVGLNVAKALTALGNPTELLSVIGMDAAGQLVYDELHKAGLSTNYVARVTDRTAQSVILYDRVGRRQINVDLKDIQQAVYPLNLYRAAARECDLRVLCNVNFSRPFLDDNHCPSWIATDVHAISDLDDPYNRDFMRRVQILFMSDECLPCSPESWAHQVLERYGPEILVIGLGAQGALLAVKSDNFVGRFAAVETRPVVSTIGAGDALFAAFIHAFRRDGDPYRAIRLAILFASYKIGTAGASEGFLSHNELEALARRVNIL